MEELTSCHRQVFSLARRLTVRSGRTEDQSGLVQVPVSRLSFTMRSFLTGHQSPIRNLLFIVAMLVLFITPSSYDVDVVWSC